MSGNPHTSRSRDAALRRLSRANRWLIAGSATLTGVLTAVAASAFPGKTLKETRATASGECPPRHWLLRHTHGQRRPRPATSKLKAPAQAPQSSRRVLIGHRKLLRAGILALHQRTGIERL